MKKRLISMILCLAMALTMMPVTGLAAEKEPAKNVETAVASELVSEAKNVNAQLPEVASFWSNGIDEIRAMTSTTAKAAYTPTTKTVWMTETKQTESVYIGDTRNVRVSGVGVKSFSSDKKAVATVDANGKVTALKEGTAKIKITLTTGKYMYLTVKVADPYKAQTVYGSDLYDYDHSVTVPMAGVDAFNVIQGGVLIISTSMEPSTATSTRSWKSSNKKCVQIFQNPTNDGQCDIIGVKPGTATVTVTTSNGKKAKWKINVVANKVTVQPTKPSSSYIKNTYYEMDNGKKIGTNGMELKSIEIVRPTSSGDQAKVICEFYVINGYFKKMTKIAAFDMFKLSFGSTQIVNGRTSKAIKVSIKQYSSGVVKLTFTGDQVLNPDYDLRSMTPEQWNNAISYSAGTLYEGNYRFLTYGYK